MPAYRVRFDDAGARRLERPLLSHQHHLTGRPDYILEHQGAFIPVEVKPARHAANPYDSDIMQLAAYCLLVEEEYGAAPPYGILRYAEHTWQVPWSDTLRQELLATLDMMREAEYEADIPRSHEHPGRCAMCSQRAVCDRALW